MVPIKTIGNLPPEFRRTERNEKQDLLKRSSEQGARAPTGATSAQTIASDKVNVSDSARIMLQRDAEVQRFAEEIQSVDTLSSEERQEIEAKVKSGFYTTNEVTSSIAGKLFEASAKDDIDSTKTDITPTRMQQVLEKIRTNQYDSESVVDVIASKILKDL